MPRRLSPRQLFHRRLALLLGAFVLAATAMAGQLVRLSCIQGDSLRDEAEKRLYREAATPTVRGRILDRKGRVLARNRPSYELAVEFGVLSGEWAATRARAYARRLHAGAWPLLTESERQEVVGRYLPAYESHVRAMYEALADAAGREPGVIDERRARIIAHVGEVATTVAERRRRRDRTEQARMGRQFTPELLEQIEERATADVAEQAQAHALVDAGDEAAFELSRRAVATAPLNPAARAGWPVPEGAGDLAIDEVPLMPGLVVRRSEDREYPFDEMVVVIDRSSLPGPLRSDGPLPLELEGVASHVLGWMGSRALDADVAQRARALEADAPLRALSGEGSPSEAPRDRGRYLPGDPAGRAGVEVSMEHQLRGLRGVVRSRLDTHEDQVVPPAPGRDVRLSIDINLQARVQAAIDPRLGLAQVQPWQGDDIMLPVGTALNGAAVVIEIDSGDILALVSTPELSRRTLASDPESILEDEINQPYINRAVAAAYPPGSILKAINLVGAVTHANYRLGERITCNGHLMPDRPDMLRCWVYRPQFGMSTHTARLGRDLDAVDALTVSCNIFFYTMGRRMGPATLASTLHEFGVGERWNLALGRDPILSEHPGRIGRNGDGSDLETFDAIQMGIGQGPVDWTPLHAAAAYATIARMGVVIPPRLVLDGEPPRVHETSLAREGFVLALAGLDGVVNNLQHGTAHALTIDGVRAPTFNAPGVHVWGKTGTATAPDLLIDPDGPPSDPNTPDTTQPPAIVRTGDHAWVVVLAGPEGDRPRYAIAVVMEYAGSGGRVSGPLANQIIHALVAEGYL